MIEARQRPAGEGWAAPQKRPRLRLALEERHDFGIAPGLRPKLRIVVRIRQEARVEDEVRVERDARLVPEGLEAEREARRVGHDDVADPAAKLRRREPTRVDALPDLREPREEAPLLGDRLPDRPAVVRERMRAARLGEAAHEAFVACVEEDHADVGAARALTRNDLRKVPEAFARARIRTDRDPGFAALYRVFRERLDPLLGQG